MAKRAGDVDVSRARSDPTANGIMIAIVAGMAAGAAHDHPSQAGVRQDGAALKGAAIKIGEFGKFPGMFGGQVIGAIAKEPVCCGILRRGTLELRMHEPFSKFNFIARWVALKSGLIKKAKALL